MDLSQLPPEMTEEQWNKEEEEEDEDEDDDSEMDDDDDEKTAQALNEQLWAEINKARAQANAKPPQISAAKQNAIVTMRLILSCVQRDPEALATLQNTMIPDLANQSLFSVLNQSAESGSITASLAKTLHQVVSGFARSETLFSVLKQSNEPAMQLDRGKRKRENDETEPPKAKRSSASETLAAQLTTAVHAVAHALSSTEGQPIDPALISSLQLPLHQIFLFVVTYSARDSPNKNMLQEVGGLIQVLGVVSGIHIGPHHHDLGTAVFPCLMSGCDKVFSRLYSLRAHQRAHADERPYHCTSCPAAFARNHDLKRHMTMHDKKAWKCMGCEKIFSRRDAFKRHKNTSQRAGKDSACADADGVEVDLDGEPNEIGREERRSKIWAGGNVQQDSLAGETGELPMEAVITVESMVLNLHPLLQARVAQTVGTADMSSQMARDGSSSLASVIARAQLQNVHSFNTPDQPTFVVPPPHDINIIQADPKTITPGSQLANYGLSEEQAKLLEHVVAAAASAAHAQAEAEAAMEEEESGAEEE